MYNKRTFALWDVWYTERDKQTNGGLLHMDTIVLCGFMSSGKTTIGKRLAKALNYAFVDTDQLLIEQTGMTIPQMFEKGGESYFRDREYETVCSAVKMHRTVISTGGGTMTFERNAVMLSENTIVVYIHRDFDRCYEAISRKPDRPLMKNRTREEVEAIYNSRISAYQKYAHITVDNNGRPDETVKALMEKIKAISTNV